MSNFERITTMDRVLRGGWEIHGFMMIVCLPRKD